MNPPAAPALRARTRETLRDLLARPPGVIGLGLVLLHLLIALSGPWLVPHDPLQMNADGILVLPRPGHPFGTDEMGRDILSRTLLGGRQALLVTGLATPLAILWGGLLGIFLGLRGGLADEILMRLVDALLALPGILPLLVLLVVFGTGAQVLIPTLAFFYGIPVIRVARAAAHDVVARDFVQAARARGHSTLSIARCEVLPNVQDTLLVEGAMRWSWMLLGFSSLSFLGYGAAPPVPDWGLMISDGRVYMYLTPWVVLPPMLALASLIIGINLAADALAKTLGIDRTRKATL